MSLPGSLLPWVQLQFSDASGVPLVGGSVEFFVTGEASHKDTFAQADLDPSSVNANPLTLDAAGRAVIFLEPGGYDVEVSDADGNLIYTVEGVEDVGATFLSSLGVTFATGATNVTSGYTVLSTDYLVTVDSSGGADPCLINLPAAASHTQQVTIKNLGAIALSIVPNGSDTIEASLSSFSVAVAASPTFPSVVLVPDGVSTWYVLASHGL